MDKVMRILVRGSARSAAAALEATNMVAKYRTRWTDPFDYPLAKQQRCQPSFPLQPFSRRRIGANILRRMKYTTRRSLTLAFVVQTHK
jgi:hypothetical protein